MKVTNLIKNPNFQKEVTIFFLLNDKTLRIEETKIAPQVIKLKAAIKYGQEDLVGARSLLDMSVSSEDDPDVMVNQGSLSYKVGLFSELPCTSNTKFEVQNGAYKYM